MYTVSYFSFLHSSPPVDRWYNC